MIYRFPKDADVIAEQCKLMNIVFTNGCFDMMHPGHLSVIRRCVVRASYMNGVVVIGVDSDASVVKLKGSDRPIFSEDHRAGLAESIKGVYLTVIFDTDDLLGLVDTVNPQLVIKGADYTADDLKLYDRDFEIVPFVPGFSTSSVIQSIKR